MPILAALMTSLFTGLSGFFTKFIAKKYALGFAAMGVFGVLTTGLMVGISTLIGGVTLALPDHPGLTTGMWLALPSPHTSAAITLAFAGDAAIFLYRWNVENLRLATYVT